MVFVSVSSSWVLQDLEEDRDGPQTLMNGAAPIPDQALHLRELQLM